MPDYIFEPLDNDPDSVYEEFVQYMRDQVPEWNPDETQLDTIMAKFFSSKAAELGDLASRVLRGIFITFGSTLLQVPQAEPTEATTTVTITASDTIGHQVDAGTLFGLTDALGDSHIFATDNTVVIPAGSSSVTDVVIRALEPGSQANDLTGTVDFVSLLDWVSTVNLLAPTSGGSDGETEEEYLNKLSANISLMAPRPILAKDFALIGRNISGIYRLTALDNFLPGTNEVQTFTHNYTAGTFTLTWGVSVTSALPWNATAAQIQAALEAMPTLEVGDVTVTGGPLPALVTISFKGARAYSDVPTIIVTNSMTGGTTITVATPTPGVPADFNAQNAVAVAGLDVNGVPISASKKAELDTYLQGLRQQNFVVSVLDANLVTVDVTANIVKKLSADGPDLQTRGTQALKDYLNSARWGVPNWPPDQRGWERVTTIRSQELYTVLNNVDGTDYVSTLTFSNGAGATQDGSDKTMLGVFPVTTPGTITVTVS